MAHFTSSAWGFLIAGSLLAGAGCGGKKSGGGPSSPAQGPLASSFALNAQDSGVPQRLLLAVGYLESRLSPHNATANYVSITRGKQPVARGTLMTQTAFGKTFKDLGLDAGKPESGHLDTQLEAYARWVQTQLKTRGTQLAANPQSPDELFYWISNLAKLQREGLEQRRNVQIIFARELIKILNDGFVWQDPDSGEKIELAKAAEPIDIGRFSSDGQSWFKLDEPSSPIFGVSQLPLITVPVGEFVNKPKRIEVIHCPLTLSGCLELQTRTKESDIHLAAHYIVPQNDPSTDPALTKMLQVADHKEVLILTDSKGDNVPVEDAIIIMLVGNSGRLVSGARQPALPTWFSDLQLRAMGQLINDVCTLLAQNDSSVQRDQCMATDGDKGVRFHFQSQSEEHRWGDIADFDPTIFKAYVKAPGGLGSEVKFDFPQDNRQFRAGDSVPLNVLFDPSAYTLELERLNRCPDGKVVWEPLRIDQVRGVSTATFSEVFHDSGANHNGDQFFRLRAYGKDGHLVGWSIADALLHDYEPEAVFASDKYCVN